MTQYQVVGPIAYATTDTARGPTKLAYYRGSLLPEGTKPTQIEHLMSVGLIEPWAATPSAVATEPVQPAGASDPAAAGAVVTGVEAGDGPAVVQDDTTGDSGPAEQGDGDDVEAKRADARAKLPADGSKPDGRAGQAVWAEWLVSKGYDYGQVARADKKELVELASGLS
jgi:hypothetical protein